MSVLAGQFRGVRGHFSVRNVPLVGMTVTVRRLWAVSRDGEAALGRIVGTRLADFECGGVPGGGGVSPVAGCDQVVAVQSRCRRRRRRASGRPGHVRGRDTSRGAGYRRWTISGCRRTLRRGCACCRPAPSRGCPNADVAGVWHPLPRTVRVPIHHEQPLAAGRGTVEGMRVEHQVRTGQVVYDRPATKPACLAGQPVIHVPRFEM